MNADWQPKRDAAPDCAGKQPHGPNMYRPKPHLPSRMPGTPHLPARGLQRVCRFKLRSAFLIHPKTHPPAGGITLTQSSLKAAAWGLAYGLPLLACSAAGHSQPAKRAFPVLAELHNAQRELVGPMTAGDGGGHLWGWGKGKRAVGQW